MEKNKVSAWMKRIEETFHGPNGIVGEKLLWLQNHETELSKTLVEKFRGYVRLMDAFLDFYIETLQNVAVIKKPQLTKMIAALAVIQTVSFWRFRASYILFLRGYFVDAYSLLRAIFENVLDIAALKLEVITIDEIFVEVEKNEKTKNLSEDDIYKLMLGRLRKSDKKVKSHLIGEHSKLSADTQRDLRIFLQLFHNAVHKCTLNIVRYYNPRVTTGKRSFPLFPEYDEEYALLYVNASYSIGWMIVRILPLLQVSHGEFSKTWCDKYQVLDESFQEVIADLSLPMYRSMEELIAKKFDFGFSNNKPVGNKT